MVLRDLVVAQRRAVRLAGVLQGRAGQPMMVRTAMIDGLSVDGLGRVDGRLERRDVLAGVDALDVPAVRLVALEHVLAERDGGVVLDGDVVVVVEQDQVAELLVAGQRGRLGETPSCRQPSPAMT